jgi:D-xylose 1-dehydrogenase (NADP+, D-xylono-1,5-lactone-forming)
MAGVLCPAVTEPVLRWGLLSTARINAALLPALRECERAEPFAVASRSASTAEAYAAKHELPRAHGSYDELIDDPDIDVVYNPLPNHLHAEWTIKAAEAGKHVLCEKPLACSLAEVDAMIAAADANDVVVAEAFMYRHHPQTKRVQELVAKGAVGEVRLVRGSFSFTLTNEHDIRMDRAMGGGSAWDIGVYPVSYARTIIGTAPVSAVARQHESESGVDRSCFGTIEFDGGAVAQFDSSFAAPFRTHLEVVGTTGVIVVPSPFKPSRHETVYVGPAGDALEPVEVESQCDLYTYEVDDLTDAVLGLGDPRVTLEDSRANVATILAVLASARRGGEPVDVEV